MSGKYCNTFLFLLVFLDLPSPWEAIKFSKDALKVNVNLHISLYFLRLL